MAEPALWEHLVQWQPATAAALAQHIRTLPDDWPTRVFGVGRPDAALILPPGATGEQFPDRAPEIAPYDEIAALDDCPACEEVEGTCRFHEGYAARHHEQDEQLREAVKARPDITLQTFMHWQADVAEAEDRGQEPPLLPAAPPGPAGEVSVGALARVLNEADVKVNSYYPAWDQLEASGIEQYRTRARYLLERLRTEQSGAAPAAPADRAAAALAEVRRLCEMTIAASIRVQAIDQARDTLAVIDRVMAGETQPGGERR